MLNQTDRYKDFYSDFRRLRWLFRFDVRYRCKRIQEVFSKLSIDSTDKNILDFGFGAGDLLKSFPSDCSLTGVDVSQSAVIASKKDPEFTKYKKNNFFVVPERDPSALPEGPFDIIISSHAIEHVFDDKAVFKAMRKRLKDDGVLAIFVPIEEPDYISFHVRNYSIQSISTTIANAGFDLIFVEGSMYINGHIWKIITIPSRRNWPFVGKIVNAIRVITLSAIPYHGVKFLDKLLHYLGFGPRQALIIAKKIK